MDLVGSPPPGLTEPPTRPASPHSCLHIREAAPEPCRFPLAVCVCSSSVESRLCVVVVVFSCLWCRAFFPSFPPTLPRLASVCVVLRIHPFICPRFHSLVPPTRSFVPGTASSHVQAVSSHRRGPDQKPSTNHGPTSVPESVPLSLKHSASLISRPPRLRPARAWQVFTHFDIYSLLFDT